MKIDKPIHSSRLQKDWYYITMGFFAWLLHRTVKVRWGFANRTKIPLGRIIDQGRFREEIENVKSLRYTEDELEWLRQNFGQGIASDPEDGFLALEYIDHLRDSRLSAIDYEFHGDDLMIEAHGLWHEGMDWETFELPTITELYGEHVMKEQGYAKERVWAEMAMRLGRKIERIKGHPTLKIGEFGLRRQFSMASSVMLDEMLVEHLGPQLAGISNVWMAMKLGVKPIGTFAHQGPMIYAGICAQDDASVRASHMRFFDDWFGVFGAKWSTAVTDTFGSKSFYEDFGAERARRWMKYKLDSGNPFHGGETLQGKLREWGTDPKTKLLNPTDGLTVDSIEAMHLMFGRAFAAMSPGWGTTLTNDTGLATQLSIVAKSMEAQAEGMDPVMLVKLSDNLAKAFGPEREVARMKRIHGYEVDERIECVV